MNQRTLMQNPHGHANSGYFEHGVPRIRNRAESRPLVAPEDDGPRLSIGLVSPGWPADSLSNGVATYVVDIADGLRALGHKVTILPIQVNLGEMVYDLSRAVVKRGLQSRAVDWLWYKVTPRAVIGQRLSHEISEAIGRAVSERGIQVLEMEETFGWAERVRQTLEIPVALRLHGPWFLNGLAMGAARDDEFNRRVRDEGHAIRRAMSLSAPSHDVLDRTRRHYGLSPEHGVVIPNPTRPVRPRDRWRPGECNPKMVLFAGRFDRHKGGDLIIDAFNKVLNAIPDARLSFVGPDRGLEDEDGQRWDLESFVDERLPGARESGQVTVYGQQPREVLDDLRREAAVTTVCSRYEVFGLTAAEAMAIGAPIVAARVGGLAEIIRDNLDGLLHTPGDVDDLAEKIITVLRDPARAANLGRSAAARAEQDLQPVAVAARLVTHYRRLLAADRAEQRAT